MDYKEASKRYLEFDKIGFENKELYQLFESGKENEKRRQFFSKISKVKKNDHQVLKDIKHKIKHLIEQEIHELDLDRQISEGERDALI